MDADLAEWFITPPSSRRFSLAAQTILECFLTCGCMASHLLQSAQLDSLENYVRIVLAVLVTQRVMEAVLVMMGEMAPALALALQGSPAQPAAIVLRTSLEQVAT